MLKVRGGHGWAVRAFCAEEGRCKTGRRKRNEHRAFKDKPLQKSGGVRDTNLQYVEGEKDEKVSRTGGGGGRPITIGGTSMAKTQDLS